MGFADEARKAAARDAARELRKLVENVNQLMEDMASVKGRLDRLERKSGQSQEEAARRHQFDSDE
jgi:hypothetical protein